MSASVYMACNKEARSVSHSTVRLPLDTPAEETPRALGGSMLVLAKSSLPLYAIRQQEQEPAALPQD
jgi:hypothetical protein